MRDTQLDSTGLLFYLVDTMKKISETPAGLGFLKPKIKNNFPFKGNVN